MQTEVTTLKDLPVGGKMRISDISQSAAAGRLTALGFEQNEIIEKLYIGFGGSPIAVYVCGSVIAVRASDAEMISGESEPSAENSADIIKHAKTSRGGECYF